MTVQLHYPLPEGPRPQKVAGPLRQLTSAQRAVRRQGGGRAIRPARFTNLEPAESRVRSAVPNAPHRSPPAPLRSRRSIHESLPPHGQAAFLSFGRYQNGINFGQHPHFPKLVIRPDASVVSCIARSEIQLTGTVAMHPIPLGPAGGWPHPTPLPDAVGERFR